MIHDKKVSVGAGYVRKDPYEYEGKKYEADIKDADIIKIKSGATEVVKDYQGKQSTSLVFKVETRNGIKAMTFNNSSVNNMIDAFGKDDANWIDKEVKVWMFKALVSGKMQKIVYVAHKDAEMTEDEEGRIKFLTPENKDINIDDGTPTEEGEELNWDDIDAPKE